MNLSLVPSVVHLQQFINVLMTWDSFTSRHVDGLESLSQRLDRLTII